MRSPSRVEEARGTGNDQNTMCKSMKLWKNKIKLSLNRMS